MEFNFSFQRLALVMRRDMWQNKRLYIGVLIGMMAAVTGAEMNHILSFDERPNAQWIQLGMYHQIFKDTLWALFYILFCISQCLLVSFMGAMFSKKTDSIDYLMLPATMLEKFVSRLLLVVVGGTVGFILMFILGDSLRWLIQRVFNWAPWVSDVFFPQVLRQVGNDLMHMDFSDWSLVSVYLCIHAIYMLCGNIWGRKAWSWLTVALAGIAGLLFSCSSLFRALMRNDEGTLLLFGCLAVLFYGLAYRFFVRATIKPKSWNLFS